MVSVHHADLKADFKNEWYHLQSKLFDFLYFPRTIFLSLQHNFDLILRTRMVQHGIVKYFSSKKEYIS